MDQNEDQQSVMVALLPTQSDWCQIELPHLTLVYAGEIPDLQVSDFNDMAKDAAMLALLSNPISVPITGQSLFGPNKDTNVFTLQKTPELLSMRRAVERWNASEFPFNPHVTIGPAGSIPSYIPGRLSFNRIMVGWGDQQLTFNMASSVVPY